METKIEKMGRGMGYVVSVIIIVDFIKEIYADLKPRVKKCMARRKDEKDEQPQKTDEEEEATLNEPEEQ